MYQEGKKWGLMNPGSAVAWECRKGRTRSVICQGREGMSPRRELFRDLQVGKARLASENCKNFEGPEQQVQSEKEGAVAWVDRAYVLSKVVKCNPREKEGQPACGL